MCVKPPKALEQHLTSLCSVVATAYGQQYVKPKKKNL